MARRVFIDQQGLLVIASFAVFWFWTDFCFYSRCLIDACAVPEATVSAFQLIGLATSACSAAVAAFMPDRTCTLLDNNAVRMGVAGTMCAAVLGSFVFGLVGMGWFAYPLCLLGGLAAGFYMLVWVRACAVTTVRHGVLVLVSGSIALAGIVVLLAHLLPLTLGVICAGALPILGMLVYRRLRLEVKPDNRDGGSTVSEQTARAVDERIPDGLGLTWRFVLGIVVFSVATGSVQFLFVPDDPVAATVIGQARLASRYAVALIVFAGTVLFSWKPHPIFLVGSFAMIAAFLILPFLSASQGVIATAATNGGYTCLELMVWTVLFETARKRDEDPVRIVGQGRLLMAGAAFIGVLVCTTLGFWETNGPSMASASATVVYALTIVTVLIVDEPRSQGSWNLIEDSYHRSATSPGLDERCQTLAELHGLTPREGEVLVLLASGRSAPAIAERLDIATSTVNFHTRHIYEKLGVSSKQQTIDLVENVVIDENPYD